MFYRATINANLVNWNLSSLTNASLMFASGTYDNNGAVINGNISGLPLSGITNANTMFRDAKINTSVALSNLDLSSVTTGVNMFEGTIIT